MENSSNDKGSKCHILAVPVFLAARVCVCGLLWATEICGGGGHLGSFSNEKGHVETNVPSSSAEISPRNAESSFDQQHTEDGKDIEGKPLSP